jgi:TonB family protein
MNNATAPAELPREYLWAFPGAPIRIHLKLAVVSRLRDHLLKGSNPDPALCRERGGLLLGTVRTNNVEITDFEPFRPDRLERHYVLSGSEKELLRMTLENRPRSSQTSVVGYFRSDFRGGVQLRPEDLAVARQFFSHPAQVFLVVRADKEGPPDAGFFFWDGGEIFGDATFMQFPFDEKLLPAQEPALSPPEKPAAQAVRELVQPAVQQLPQQPRPRSAPSKSLYWVGGVLLVLALLAGGYALQPYVGLKLGTAPTQSDPAPPQVMASPTSLSVSQPDKNVEITWDSQKPAIADARIGVLTIKDGDWQAEIPLTKVQLQMNKLIYPPKSDQLEITFEVFSSAGKSTREAMMFIRQPSVRWRSLPAAPASIPRSSTAAAAIASAPAATRPTGQAALDNAVKNEVASAPTRTFQANLLNRPKATPEPTVTEAPPAGQIQLDRGGLKAPEFLGPSLQQPVPKAPEPPPARVVVAVQPPRPLQQVKPIVPASAIAMLKRSVDIEVRVSVNEQGKVVGAKAVGPAAGLYHYLASLALQAARNWKFEPAQRGTTPVASEIALHFVFEPTAK